VAKELQGEPRERSQGYLARVDRQVTRMEKLLEELLDRVQLQTGRTLGLERRACDLVELVRGLVDEQASAPRGALIELRAPAGDVVGQWDAARMERVIGNLLSNAIKYGAGESPIVVEVAREGEDSVVRVSDRGPGIAPRDRERIFEWFTRGENAGLAASGTGIGLAGARQIVEQHGGTLTVESEVGVGSTFTVRLPADAAPAALPGR
jgi:signal transduction histidine kinase